MSTFSNKDCIGSKDILRHGVFLKSNSASDLFSEFTSKFSKTSNIVNGSRLGRRHFIKYWTASYMCKLTCKFLFKVELRTEWRLYKDDPFYLLAVALFHVTLAQYTDKNKLLLVSDLPKWCNCRGRSSKLLWMVHHQQNLQPLRQNSQAKKDTCKQKTQ